MSDHFPMNDIESLVAVLEKYNAAYRAGKPEISDAEYDQLVERLRQLAPEHQFLHTVEPEKFDGKRQVRHPVPMLSTEKAYDKEQLERFIRRVQKEGEQIGVSPVEFRITPKLDGLAGRDDGRVFASRGNGEVGYEISSAFEKGVVAIGGRGGGVGEIVVSQSYFEKHMAGFFEHPRNMVVGIISSDTVNENARQALADGAVRFVPYASLDSWTGPGERVLAEIDDIVRDFTENTDYPMDGVVVEATDENLRRHMGATAHHYRWQVAVKSKGETAVTRVEEIFWQVGRTGNVTPVMEVVPVTLSGATIRRVTAHNAGNVKNLRIGPGAQIEIIRSGEVIPKLEKVMEASGEITLPERCPSCESTLAWNNDFLKCLNIQCPAQMEQRISHWFRTLGTADWFGIKTIQRLVSAGYDSLEKIYAMTEADFLSLEFGPVQSRNLADALYLSRTREVEDWRFLAAFGIPNLGKGDSRKLLSHMSLEKLVSASADDIEQINGFGPVTSQSITQGMAAIHQTLQHMMDLGFPIQKTPLQSEAVLVESPISGKKIVFTGKMVRGSREEMQAAARQLNATVQSAVGKSTDYLVCGEKVGATKLEKAEALGVSILSEDAYYQLINHEG